MRNRIGILYDADADIGYRYHNDADPDQYRCTKICLPQESVTENKARPSLRTLITGDVNDHQRSLFNRTNFMNASPTAVSRVAKKRKPGEDVRTNK
jgi:hypothetical protein